MIKTKIILIFVLLTIFIFINYRKVEKLSIKQTEYDKYVNSSDTAVDILKPTLTLYYDRRDPNCKYYYDDTLTSKIFDYNIAKKDLQDEFDFLKDTYNSHMDDDDEHFKNNTIPFVKHYKFRKKGNKDDHLYTTNFENIYNDLRESKYDFEFIISKIEDLRNYVSDLEDKYTKIKTYNDFGDFNKSNSSIKEKKRDEKRKFNEKKEYINEYIKERYIDEVKLTELVNDIENFERSNLGVWNQIKTLYYNYENGFPFLHPDILTLEEVLCYDGKMPECVEKEIITFKEPEDEDGEEDEEDKVISRMEVDLTKIIQFPRDENLVDKLPKVIFTYQIYDKEGEYNGIKTKTVEYDGIYNLNNENVKLGRDNLLKFLEFIMRDRLELKIVGTKQEKEEFHQGKLGTIESSDLSSSNTDHSFDKVISYDKDNSLIKYNPNFELNFSKIKKCKKCSEFIVI